MKIKHLFIYIFFFIVCFNSKSQTNLVSNSSFENHTSCPTFMLQWDKCIGWSNCNGNVGSGLWGTPDYYHTCGLVQSPYNPVPPNTGMGYCNPHTGNAMMGLACYNSGYSDAREYISSQLICPLTAGNTYTVSFWISASSIPEVKYNSSHFGVYLSNAAVFQSGLSLVSVTPQYEISSLITNTIWQQHTFTISPTSNLNYITLGCFKSDAAITKVLSTPSAWQPYSNYFIDDIEVFGSTSSGSFSVTPSSTNIECNGNSNGSATVTATGSGPYSYLWSPGGYTTSTVSNLSAGNYTVTVNGGNCNIISNTVSITQPSILNSSLTANSYTICKNNLLSLIPSITGGTPSYSVNWSTGISTPSISISPSVSTAYNYTVTDANNCVKTQSVLVNVDVISANFINSTPQCSGLISFTNTSTNSVSSYWDFGDGQNSVLTTTTTNNYVSSGSYNVSLVSTSNFGCKDTIQKTVLVNAAFIYLDFDYYTRENKCLDSLYFINKSIGATSYLWDFGDGNISIQTSPSYVYGVGFYTVTLIGSNPSCQDTLEKEIIISGNSNLNNGFMPNVFTPNGDKVNDVFDFELMSICEDFTFEIYDRWGLLILKMNDKKQSFWDGRTSSGQEVTDGTYFYIMNTESGRKLKGTVTLFR